MFPSRLTGVVLVALMLVGCRCGAPGKTEVRAGGVPDSGMTADTRGSAAMPRDDDGRPPPLRDEEALSKPRGPNAPCWAPDEPGCNPCCEMAPDGSCTVRSWEPGPDLSSVSHVQPWYNGLANQPKGSCPANCRPCARCTRRDEWDFRQLRTRTDCDCTQPPGVDACRDPSSCGCYCKRWKRFSEICPELIEHRKAEERK